MLRILVVEDESILGDSIVTILKHGFEASVDLARDGSEAMALAEAQWYDLVVLDWWIPPPTGIELLTLWRSGKHVGRVLMLTGALTGPEREVAMAAGADDFLEKPFSLEALRDRVAALLASAEPPDTSGSI